MSKIVVGYALERIKEGNYMLQKTVRLYDLDAYQTEFEAVVVSCEKKEDIYEVVLDKTLFFPEEGGQTPDMGTIDGIEVTDVQIKGDVIFHTMRQEIPVGKKIAGKIDWNHRFHNMQQHSGEHIFSGLVNRHFGFNNVGFHLSNQIVTMDFDGVLTDADVEKIEWEVNEVISKNLPIEVSIPAPEQLADMQYRSKIEIEGEVRIVTIPGYDVCACCAPHVKQTGEIGMLKVMSIQNYKGGVRISILCGFRALKAFAEKSKIVSELITMFSAKQENLLEQIGKMKESNQELKGAVAACKRDLMEYKINNLNPDETNVVLFEADLDTAVVRNTVNVLVEKHDGICAVFTGDDESGYQFILGSKNVDCGQIAKIFREKYDMKCGGKECMIQGSVNKNKNEIVEILHEI